MVEVQTLHPFEAAGLGLAPFRFRGMSEAVYVACPGAPEQPAGSCDYCGQAIRYCCHVAASDGREFIVGCDCIRKLDRADNRLLTAMERAVAAREKLRRDERREAARLARRAQIEAELAAQRDRNGGLTDAEVRVAAREAAESARQAEVRAANAWLLSVLLSVPPGPFISDMIALLGQHSAGCLSPKQLAALAGIYSRAKSGKRSGREYDAALDEFDSHFEEQP